MCIRDRLLAVMNSDSVGGCIKWMPGNTVVPLPSTGNTNTWSPNITQLGTGANQLTINGSTGVISAPTINASTLLQISGVDITSLYQEKPWVAGQVNQNSTTASIIIQSGKNNFTATRSATGITVIGFPNIGGAGYTPFIQLRSGAGFTSFVGPTSTSVQLYTYNSSSQFIDTNYTFFIYRTF